jgi:hypothetical protein
MQSTLTDGQDRCLPLKISIRIDRLSTESTLTDGQETSSLITCMLLFLCIANYGRTLPLPMIRPAGPRLERNTSRTFPPNGHDLFLEMVLLAGQL